MPKIGTFFSVIVCHGDCHTGTGMSHGDLKLEIRVRRMHTQLQRALNGPKKSLGGQDMIIFPNVATMLQRQRKGLSRRLGKVGGRLHF